MKRTRSLSEDDKRFYAGFTPMTVCYDRLALNALKDAQRYVTLAPNLKEHRWELDADIHNAIYCIERVLGID